MRKLADFMSLPDVTRYKPRDDTSKTFTCPENPEGQSGGNFASFQINQYISVGNPGSFKAYQPREVGYVELPSDKVYWGDGRMNSPFYTAFFHVYVPGTNGQLTTWHDGRNTLSFLDGHVQTLGSPPLLPASNASIGSRWLVNTYPSPF